MRCVMSNGKKNNFRVTIRTNLQNALDSPAVVRLIE